MSSPRVVSVQVGRTRTYPNGKDGKPWRSAIGKEPVQGPIALGPEGLQGDAQADKRFHGGPERALLAYSQDHFAGWEIELGRAPLGPGSFGENLTVADLTEASACIGDSFALGTAVVQVSQPRMPCVKLARRLEAPEMVARALGTGRTGFYLRVLVVGAVEPGPLRLLERPFPALSVAAALLAVHDPRAALPLLPALLECPLLYAGWKSAIARARARLIDHL